MPKTQVTTFAEFMEQRKEAASAYVRGESAPLSRIVATEGSASFFGPSGGHVTGAQNVESDYRDGARVLGKGETHFEIVQMGDSDTLAFWTGIQRATASLGGSEPKPLDLRVTEIFHREGKDWKLIHRHADQLVEPTVSR